MGRVRGEEGALTAANPGKVKVGIRNSEVIKTAKYSGKTHASHRARPNSDFKLPTSKNLFRLVLTPLINPQLRSGFWHITQFIQLPHNLLSLRFLPASI